jgi:hypothetical protein
MNQQDECGCNDNNCPHRTSEVTLFDGVFTSITVPEGAGLNEVLALLENYVMTSASSGDVNFTLSANSACLGLSAGTYSFEQIMTAVINKVCSNASSITELQNSVGSLVDQTTTNTQLTDIVYPDCFSTFAGVTSTDLFNAILEKLCELVGEQGPVIDDPIFSVNPDVGQEIDPKTPSVLRKSENARVELTAEVIKAIVDNNNFVYDHTAPLVSPTSFNVRLYAMRGVVSNFIVIRKSLEDFTVNASVDTYFYLSGDGTILRREVANGAPAPATPTTSHELYKVVSDGSGVTSVDVLYADSALNPIPLGIDSVKTINIEDDAVTSDKIADIILGQTTGELALIRFRTNDQGQIIQQDGNLDITGISNGQILVYNAGLNRFENGDNTNISSSNVMPKANAAGTDYENSSISEDTNQVLSSKKVEVNGGVAEDDSKAIMNLVSVTQYFKVPRMTSAQAGVISLVGSDGGMIYVTDTDATFTSVGFWGVESGAWVKL